MIYISEKITSINMPLWLDCKKKEIAKHEIGHKIMLRGDQVCRAEMNK